MELKNFPLDKQEIKFQLSLDRSCVLMRMVASPVFQSKLMRDGFQLKDNYVLRNFAQLKVGGSDPRDSSQNISYPNITAAVFFDRKPKYVSFYFHLFFKVYFGQNIYYIVILYYIVIFCVGRVVKFVLKFNFSLLVDFYIDNVSNISGSYIHFFSFYAVLFFQDSPYTKWLSL